MFCLPLQCFSCSLINRPPLQCNTPSPVATQQNATWSHCNILVCHHCNASWSPLATHSSPIATQPNSLSLQSVCCCNGLSIATLSSPAVQPSSFLLQWSVHCNDLILPSIYQPLQHSHPLWCNATLSHCNALSLTSPITMQCNSAHPGGVWSSGQRQPTTNTKVTVIM